MENSPDLARLLLDALRPDAPTRLPTGSGWPHLLTLADWHGLTPALFAVWHPSSVWDTLPYEVQKYLRRAYAENAVRHLNFRNEWLEIGDLLHSAQVTYAPLFDWALAERLYGDPAHGYLPHQIFLIPPAQAETADTALRHAHYQPLPAVGPTLWQSALPSDDAPPRLLQVQTGLWAAPWRGLHLRAAFPLRTTPKLELTDEWLLLYLTVGVAQALMERTLRLHQLLDVARFVQQTPNLNWDVVVQQAESANVGRLAYVAFYWAHHLLGTPLPPRVNWRQFQTQTPAALYHWLTTPQAAHALLAPPKARHVDYGLIFLATQTWGEKWGVLRHWVWPGRGEARQLSLPPLRHLVEGVKSTGKSAPAQRGL